MLRRSALLNFAATKAALGGGGLEKYPDADRPNAGHHVTARNKSYPKQGIGMTPQKFFDTNVSLYDDAVSGISRVRWQEPARNYHMFSNHEAVMMEEHDKEEWNEKPYVGVSHLYEPPIGCKERPIRIDGTGNPGDFHTVMCLGNCAPHVPFNPTYRMVKSYAESDCPMCSQWFYVHNRPWLVVHPDWTDEPADDEGPAFTFAEVEAEFDRDFHEFSIYLNYE